MSSELALGIIAGVGVPVLIFILGGLVHAVWLLSGMKSDLSAQGEFCRNDSKAQWQKHGQHDDDFKDVRCELADHDGRLKVVESRG